MTNPFSTATTVTTVGPGRYAATIDETWNLRPLPQGGIVSAVALWAMMDLLDDPGQTIRSMHTTFVGQVANSGSPRGHLTTGIFGGTRSGFSFTDLRPPVDVPPPADYPSFRDPLPDGALQFEPMPFWAEQIEGRAALGHAPWEEDVPDRAERAMGYLFDHPPYLANGTIDPLALVILADTMPGAVGEKVGPQDRMWFAPSVDLTVHLLDVCRSPWLLAHNRARYAGDGYASADMALWDCGEDGSGTPRLVAYATQLFLFSFLT